MQNYTVCISGVLIVVGALMAFILSRKRPTLYEMVPAEAGDPAQMPKEEWRDKANSFVKRRARKIWIAFGVYVLLVLVGTGLFRAGPSIVAAWQPTATSTRTAMPTFTPRPTFTITPTYWPEETVNASFTPRGTLTIEFTSTPQIINNTIIQTVIVVYTRVVTRIVTVVITGTPPPTGTPGPTDTSVPTETGTPTITPTWTYTPTPTLTETPTP